MRKVRQQTDRLGLSRLGVHNKLLLLIYILIIFSMTTVAYYGYRSARAAYRDKALAVVSHGVRDTSQTIKEFLRTIPDDLAFVSSFYAIKRYLYWRDFDVEYKSGEWKNATVETFRSFLFSKDHYYKLRFIDTEGLEQITIRHDKTTDDVFTEPMENLQDKRHRDYFIESMRLGSKDIYVSEISFNEEHGKISKPHVPVLRFVRPVFGDNNVRYGVVVLSVYADTFLKRIESDIEKNRTRYLISTDGDYFLHPGKKSWGHLSGDQTNFQDDFPETFAKISDEERGSFSFDRKIISFERIYPHPKNRDTFWFLIEVMDENVAMQQANQFIKIFIFIFLATVLVVFLTTRYFIGGLMRPLLAITQQLRQLSQGRIDKEELVYSGNDEIGQMMRSTASLVSYLEDLSIQADKIAVGNYTESVSILSEEDKLGNAINNMTIVIKKNQQKNERQNWLTHGQGQLDNLLRGEQAVEDMAEKIITFLSTYLEAAVGTFYLSDNDGVFHLHASYAYRNRKNLANVFSSGEGMVGQAALEKKMIIINNVPERYLQVSSALGEGAPACLLVAPFLYNNNVAAVLEIGSFTAFDELQIAFIEQIADRIGIALNSAQSRLRMREVLQITQQQASDLQAQQEELKTANEEMEEQTQRLRASEEELQTNQDQLVATNEELEAKNSSLNRQKQEIEQANKELRHSRMEIEHKAEEVARASKYKSEFLANMSHELRTPLNSLLLLAQTMELNRQGNLTDDDIESVKIIHNSGNELLSLINDILDLSKIEAGHMVLVRDRISIAELLAEIKNTFQHMADNKGLALHFNTAEDTPREIESDKQKLEQVLNNLLANAVKFTDEGAITVSVSPVPVGVTLRRTDLQPADSIAIAVQDSGIGISADKQKIIFEAFQQADGGTARQYGGTGLGLSISRDLADLLGGEIQLESKEGKGSTFTLYLPVSLREQQEKTEQYTYQDDDAPVSQKEVPAEIIHIDDDRDSLEKNDRIVLVIEDDPIFADLLLQQCHENDLKCLAVPTGKEGLELAESSLPLAIILDLNLPDISGWKVLAELKERTATRHIPVHIMSADDTGIDARRKGAAKALVKPVSMEKLEQAFHSIRETLDQQPRCLLVACRDAERRKAVVTLIGNNDVRIEEAGSGLEIIEKLRARPYDCMIMGIDFADMTGFSLLNQLKATRIHIPPVIVYTDKKLSWKETEELRQYTETIIIKGVMSEERLLDESALFLHRMICKLPEKKQRMIRNLHEDDAVFQGKRILLVDDDMRNIFALAKVLKDKGMETIKAEDGVRALAVLEQEENFDLVLMDIMMPVMDGYETIKRIRKQTRFKSLPIIALTAKAMKDDRSRCITAGANDYLTKPVEMERLTGLLRLWLYQ